jgi:cysteine desulfurase family protein
MSIFLDNAATTFPKPEIVYSEMDSVLREIGVGPGRGGYNRGVVASRLVFQAREVLSSFFGLADSSRLIFTHSATESLNLALNGILKPGDHVVTTSMEHNSLARPLHRAEKSGVEVTWVEGDKTGYVEASKIAAALKPSTRLVAFSHCSNVTGTIQPLSEISALTRASGILLLLDAAQSAGYIPIDCSRQGIDLLAAPGHKGLFGPPGTGILAIADGINLSPLVVGGTGGYSSDPDQPETLPERFESGTMNVHGIVGLKAGVEFIMATGLDVIRRKEQVLLSRLLDGLCQVPGIHIYGPDRDIERGVPVSFNLNGMDPAQIGYQLDREYDISVRVGLHCAPNAHKTIGTYPGGTVRVSPGFYTSEQDIDTFLDALHHIAGES